jgi:hypothetical protein
MGRACSTRGREEECIQGFCGKHGMKENHYEDLDIGGRIILKCISD